MAGRVPDFESRERWFRVDITRGLIPTQWLWVIRPDRQRLGVDDRLVPTPQQNLTILLRRHQPKGRYGRPKLRSAPQQFSDSPKGHERRLISLRAELLPALPARGPDGAGGRYVYLSPWISLYSS